MMNTEFNNLYKLFLTQATIIKEAYESGDMLGIQPHIEVMFSNSEELTILTYNEFINKCKVDSEFAKDWYVDVNIKMLSLRDRVDIFNSKMLKEGIRTQIPTVGVDDGFWEECLEEIKHNIPTKLITLTYNNETIESYE